MTSPMIPYQEVVIARDGTVLYTRTARYDTIEDYRQQFTSQGCTRLGPFLRLYDPLLSNAFVLVSLVHEGTPPVPDPWGEGPLDRTDLMTAVYDAAREVLTRVLTTTEGLRQTRQEIIEAIAKGAQAARGRSPA